MHPFVPKKTGDAPQHAERLDRAGRLDLPHVRRFPAELIQNAAYGLLRGLVIAADEHRQRTPFKRGIDHAGMTDGIEGQRFTTAQVASYLSSRAAWFLPFDDRHTVHFEGSKRKAGYEGHR